MFRIITRPGCIWCERTKQLLNLLGYNYEEDEVDTPEKVEEFKKTFSTFPQIYHNNLLIGGYDNLILVAKQRLQW